MLQSLRNALTRRGTTVGFSPIAPEPSGGASAARRSNPTVPDHVLRQRNEAILRSQAERIENSLNTFIQNPLNTQTTDQDTQARLIRTFKKLCEILRLPGVTQSQQDRREAIALSVILRIADPNLKMTLSETLATTLCDTNSQNRLLLALTIINSTTTLTTNIIGRATPSGVSPEHYNRAATCLETIINSLRTNNDGISNGRLENLITGMTHANYHQTIRNLGFRLNSPFKYLGEATIPRDELPEELKDSISFDTFTKAEPMYVICSAEHNNGKQGTNWHLFSETTIDNLMTRGRTTDPHTRSEIIGIKKVIIANPTHPTINLPGALPPS
jgi:hypothetical protein